MRIRTILNTFLLLAVTCSSLFAQSVSQPGKFKGLVLDEKQKRVRKASVTVEGRDYTGKLMTDKVGEFEVALPAGVYKITVEKAGLKRFPLVELAVEPNTQCTYTFNMGYFNPNEVIID